MSVPGVLVSKLDPSEGRMECCFCFGADCLEPCQNEAVYEVRPEGGGYEDYTHACADHVDELARSYVKGDAPC